MPTIDRIHCNLLMDGELTPEVFVHALRFPTAVGCVVGSDIGKRLKIVIEDQDAQARPGRIRTLIHVSIDGHTMPGCTIPLAKQKAVISGIPCREDAKLWKPFIFAPTSTGRPTTVLGVGTGCHGRIVVQVSFGTPHLATGTASSDIYRCEVGSTPFEPIFPGYKTHQVALGNAVLRNGSNWMLLERIQDLPIYTFVFTYIPTEMIAKNAPAIIPVFRIPPWYYSPQSEKEKKALELVTVLQPLAVLDSKMVTVAFSD